MREILFRGKRIDNGEWVEGYCWTNGIGNHFIKVIKDKDNNFVGNAITNDFEVNPETVGQYTGIEDANGKKIFEGDVIKTTLGGSVFAVKIGECFPEPVKKYCLHYGIKKHTVYCLHSYDKQGEYLFEDNRAFEVIGNIHDNPELVEEELK